MQIKIHFPKHANNFMFSKFCPFLYCDSITGLVECRIYQLPYLVIYTLKRMDLKDYLYRVCAGGELALVKEE